MDDTDRSTPLQWSLIRLGEKNKYSEVKTARIFRHAWAQELSSSNLTLMMSGQRWGFYLRLTFGFFCFFLSARALCKEGLNAHPRLWEHEQTFNTFNQSRRSAGVNGWATTNMLNNHLFVSLGRNFPISTTIQASRRNTWWCLGMCGRHKAVESAYLPGGETLTSALFASFTVKI